MTVAATASVQDRAGSHVISEVLGVRLEAMPKRLSEFKTELDRARAKLLELTKRQDEVKGLSIHNKVIKLIQDEKVDEFQQEIKHWQAVAEFYEQAIDDNSGEVPELAKLYSAAAGVSTPSNGGNGK